MFLCVIVVLLLSGFVQQSLQINVTAKCCKQTLQIQETNRTLECKDKINTRFEILAGSDNFLENNSDGECIDSTGEDFFVYQVSDWKVISKEPVLTPFPKCCPKSYVYNPEIHSCSRKQNVTQDYIRGRFVKVGLPHCKIIHDKVIKKLNNFDVIFEIETRETESFCLDRIENGDFVIRECQKKMHGCNNTRCFKKCCPDGQSFVGGAICRNTYVHGIKLTSQHYSPFIENLSDKYELIYGAGCPNVSLLSKNIIQYTITKDGLFRYYYNYSGKFLEDHYSNFKSYCIEHAAKGNFSGYGLFLCYGGKDVVSEKFTYTLWAKILSCVFLVLTILFYIYLEEVKSTFGKILISYCLAMTFLMVTLTVAYIYLNPNKVACKIIGYLLIFFNGASLAWISIMSLDIWLTFGTPKCAIGSDQKKNNVKKFLIYFLYGWGVPLLHMLLILVLEITKILPELIQPYVGNFHCFLENGNYARTAFLLIPQLVCQIINTVLFIKTIRYYSRVKNEINRINDSSRRKESGKFTADKERLVLIVKLAVIMIILWIFEVITSFFENMRSYSTFTKILEIILDNISCLQGVFIFVIFICKKKAFNSIKEKLGLAERGIPLHSSVTQSTFVNRKCSINRRQATTSISESRM